MLREIKAVITDLDDTLFLQKHFKESGFRVVANYLTEQHDMNCEETLECFQEILNSHGPSHPQHFNFLLAKLGITNNCLPELIDIFIHHEPDIQCFTGVKYTLKELKKKFNLGLLTDGRASVQQSKVKSLGLGHFFDSLLFSDLLHLSKPDSKLFQHFEDHFQLAPEELLYIGDNPLKDFVEANRRGWKTLRVQTGEYRNFIVSKTYDAHITIDNFQDLLNYL